MELDIYHRRILAAYAKEPEGLGTNEVVRETKLPNKTVVKKKKDLLEWKLIFICNDDVKNGQKKICRISQGGLQYATKHNIERRYGLVGLKWAEDAWEKGYKIRFLNEFTNLEEHEDFLLAWHPETGDVRLAEIFGIGEFNSTRYQGVYVDRNINSNRPLRGPSSLRQFVMDNVNDFTREEQVARAIKKFYEEHNCFVAILLPKKQISFGYPKKKQGNIQEIGRFNSLMFVGFQGEGIIPFIPKINIMAGGFNFSENIKVKLNYDVNLVALYDFVKLKIKEINFPNSVDPLELKQVEKAAGVAGLANSIIKLGLECKNLDQNNYYCKIMKIGCIALEEVMGKPNLNLKKCPILVDNLQKGFEKQPPKAKEPKTQFEHSITYNENKNC